MTKQGAEFYSVVGQLRPETKRSRSAIRFFSDGQANVSDSY